MATLKPAGIPGEKESLSASTRGGISTWPIIVVMILLAGLYLSLALLSERLSYGSERDGYLVGISAQRLTHHQSWEPSRTPGFPVFEYLVSWVFTSTDARRAKAVVALFSLAVIALFMILGLRANKDRKVILLVAVLFSLVPLWLQSSFLVLDYSVSLFCAVAVGVLLEAASFAKLRSVFLYSLAAGVMLAFGIGSRITTALLLPAVMTAVILDKNTKTLSKTLCISVIALSATVGAVVFYKPAYDLFGIGFLNTTHVPIPFVANMKMVMYQLLHLGGGVAGSLVLLVLIVIATRNIKSRWLDRLWTERGVGIRSLLLFAVFNTMCYLRNPEKATYFLPLLVGIMLILVISLQWRDRFILAVAVVVMVVGSIIQIFPAGIAKLEIIHGQVLDEWRHQQMDRPLFAAFQSLITDSHRQTLLIGYPATDHMVVWFYDSTRVVETLPHPFGRTLWGTPTFYPDNVYEIRGMLLADPPLLLSGFTRAKLDILLAQRGIDTVNLVRSWIREPVEIPAAWRRGKTCLEVFY